MNCKIEGCVSKILARGLCNRHYLQMRKYGYTFGDSSRTRTDPNKYIFKDDICIIVLYDIRGNEKARTIIDRSDYDKVKSYKWSVFSNYRVADSQGLFLHDLIINHKGNNNIMIDHIDGDGFNNQKQNLRIATCSQNAANCSKRSHNTSGFKGVYKQGNKWMAKVVCKGKQHYFGFYDSILDAAKAYNNGAILLFGEFAKLNNVKE